MKLPELESILTVDRDTGANSLFLNRALLEYRDITI